MASTLIVFSCQRWDSACQHLQHLLSRLARQHPIVFVEEPRYHPGRSFLEKHSPLPEVQVCSPHTPSRTPGFHDGQLPYLRGMVRELAQDHTGHIAWLGTPLALPLLQELDAELVVADCTGTPSAPRHLKRLLRQREHALLSTADLVLTSGPSRLSEQRLLHPNTHCLPAGVDVRDFQAALDRANSHPLHRDIPGPRLGYHGVIDERLDFRLICDVADAHPRWQIVLVGPVCGISSAALPRRTNIHYLGPQPYEDLPRFLAGWDVCLLPFARRAARRGINAATALEYMAAELPIVATPLPDVVECHAGVIALAEDAVSFVAACERALLASPAEREALVARMRRQVAPASWDASAAEVAGLLRTARQSRQRGALEGAGVLMPEGALVPAEGAGGAHVAA